MKSAMREIRDHQPFFTATTLPTLEYQHGFSTRPHQITFQRRKQGDIPFISGSDEVYCKLLEGDVELLDCRTEHI